MDEDEDRGFKFMGSMPPTVDSALFMSQVQPDDKLIVIREDEFNTWHTRLKWAAVVMFLCGVALGMVIVGLLWTVFK